MSPFEITGLMFASMLLLMATGLPVAFCLGSVGVLSALFLWGTASLNVLYFSVLNIMNNFVLIAVPLFVFMGYVLHESGIANDLFDAVHLWMGRLRGGLGIGTVAICAIMAAMVGVSGAATISMGVIAVPAMLERKYNKDIAIGLVQAGGALGFLIPPSMMMIMYAFVSGESVGRLFAGGVVPGVILAVLYMIYVGVRCHLQPQLGPAISDNERASWGEKVSSLKGLILPGMLIMAVLGCIFFGVTSPTEAAAVGATGALACAAIRKALTWKMLMETAQKTLNVAGFTALIIIGAIVFSKVYTGLGATAMIKSAIVGLDMSPWIILIVMQLSFFVLGMFLDDLAILFLCMPIFLPIIKALGFDPVWFAIMYVVNMQMAYITPPYGINLFYMKAVAPKGVSMGDIYRSVIPFVVIQLAALILFMIFPKLITWLPDLLFG
ncbi:TRAP transporter large permease [Desulforhopalus singaporensis]|uniref:TRAP transporter, DctM subunit n=1 Tax=Desulforhopalus singaporensis TaxID=91360 RepID=A0A1H0W0H8_9BACT|nr:TRAP transporter large permease subunit [Desulforhopalus singaporensis]SDP84025.1 TRAP transporter, DctM subunit [Desulforhopalus singaporensis]